MASTVAVYDLQVYKESTLYLEFQFNLVDENGTTTGPYDLSGIELELSLRDVLSTDKVWLSSDPTDEDGSYINIVNAPGGEVNINISSTTLSRIRSLTGDWALRRVYGPDHKEMMLLGSVVVNAITAGGNT